MSEYPSVSLTVILPPAVNFKLSKASDLSMRSKRSEAVVRLKDHLERFPKFKPIHILTESKGYEAVNISLKLDSIVNKMLTEAIEVSGNLKIDEALIRISDHLVRFESTFDVVKNKNQG